jgi:hypothetical protein
MRSHFYWLTLSCWLLALSANTLAQENPVRPYVNPAQLDCPMPKHSFYKQPWRGFLETRSGYEFLHGIGINYNVPKNDETAVRLLAEAGFKAFRIEIGWGSVKWDESGINNESRYVKLLALCKQYGIRPTLLLNANHGVPSPAKFFNKKLMAEAKKGDTAVTLADVKDIVPGYSGLSGLSGYIAAEVIITDVDAVTGKCTLSKPLPKDLPTDKPVSIATLKYLPFFPVGTKQYEESAAGWLRYAHLVSQLAGNAGIEDFDVEIWNELSFGSRFVHATNYYDPAPFKETKDFLHPGGTCWELSRRTVEQVKKEYPKARCIWGWSNTTFYHCPIKELPPGIAGQSYHPYGTGTRKFPAEEADKNRPELNLEGYTPTIEMRMPEGWAQEFYKTECLMRLLNPQARLANRPLNTEHFYHYMTEHGVAPPEVGVTDAEGCWRVKTMCALRSYCLWMNKGIDTLEYYCAWDKDVTGMGLMPVDMPKLAEGTKFEEVATPPMKAVRNLTRAFAGAVALEKTQPITVEATEIGEPRKIFDGDAMHPPLWQRDALAVLPWQINEQKFVIAVYAMTYDVTKPWADQSYRLGLAVFPDRDIEVACYDPMEDRNIAIEKNVADGKVTVTLPVSDHPRLLEITIK